MTKSYALYLFQNILEQPCLFSLPIWLTVLKKKKKGKKPPWKLPVYTMQYYLNCNIPIIYFTWNYICIFFPSKHNINFVFENCMRL